MKPLAVLLLCFVFPGCAVTADKFTKAGATETQRADDGVYCDAYAEANRGPMVSGGLVGAGDLMGRRNNLFKLCMMDRGYRPI